MRRLVLVIMLALVGVGLLMLLFLNRWLKLWGLVPIVLSGVMFYAGLKRIPNFPPHVALLTFWGRRLPVVIQEGLQLFADYLPFFIGGLLVDVSAKNADFVPKNVITSDGVPAKVEVSVTYAPNRYNGHRLLTFLNLRGQEGVEDIMDDVIEQATRLFARGMTWDDFRGADIDLVGFLAARLSGEVLSPDTIDRLMVGDADVEAPRLGLVLFRLNIGTIEPLGEMARAMEQKAVASQRVAAEKISLDAMRTRTDELKGSGIPAPRALEAVQLERRQVEKKITEVQGLEGPAEIFGKAIAAFFKK